MLRKYLSIFLILFTCLWLLALVLRTAELSFAPIWLMPMAGGMLMGVSMSALWKYRKRDDLDKHYLRSPALDHVIGSLLGLSVMIAGYFYL